MAEIKSGKIVLTGAAGLVGQNLVPRLIAKGFVEIVAIDKHPTNVKILENYHPTIRVLNRDLAEGGSEANDWEAELAGCQALVIAHAQIGGLVPEEYVRNNVVATERLLEAAARHKVPYIVSISSSVVNSMAIDDYTETKKAQEALVAACGIGLSDSWLG
jgi:nucleoside-diphosphate-sugar epimerase